MVNVNVILPNILIIRKDNIKFKIKKIINCILFSKILFFIQFKLGPMDIKIKNGIKKGINNLLKNGGPTEIFWSDKTSRKIG